MAIIVRKALPASNKPPAPEPTPKESIFPYKPEGIGHDVWVSIPKLDKLTIVGHILPEQFASHVQLADVKDYSQIIMSGLATGQVIPTTDTKYYNDFWSMAQLAAGPDKVPVHVSVGRIPKKIIEKTGTKAVHWLRIEFNPSALGSDGVLDLLDDIHAATAERFHVGWFLATARISRLDVAIDVVGLRVPDLIITADGQGKSKAINGQDGVLETVYLFKEFEEFETDQLAAGKTIKPKGLGTHLVRLYDKAREQKGVGKHPPYGPAPVSRIEVEKKRFGPKQARLADIASLKNPMQAIRLGYAWSSPPGPLEHWLMYVQCRRSGGAAWAIELMRLTDAEAIKYEQAYVGASNVLDAKLVWTRWKKALANAGIPHLVQSAEMYSAGSWVGDGEKIFGKKYGHAV